MQIFYFNFDNRTQSATNKAFSKKFPGVFFRCGVPPAGVSDSSRKPLVQE